MSQENVELSYRAFDAFNRRDIDAYLPLMDPDVEGFPRSAFMEDSYHGHDGMRRWWKNWLDVFPDWSIEVLAVHDRGELTVADLFIRGRGTGSDVPLEGALWYVARWREGKCVWWRSFDTEAEALAAAGGSE